MGFIIFSWKQSSGNSVSNTMKENGIGAQSLSAANAFHPFECSTMNLWYEYTWKTSYRVICVQKSMRCVYVCRYMFPLSCLANFNKNQKPIDKDSFRSLFNLFIVSMSSKFLQPLFRYVRRTFIIPERSGNKYHFKHVRFYYHTILASFYIIILIMNLLSVVRTKGK